MSFPQEPSPLCRVSAIAGKVKRSVDLYEYLGRVEERIADCVLRIAHYESLIRDLPQEDGPAIRRAATLLGALRQAEEMHREHRSRLLAKIHEQDAAATAPQTPYPRGRKGASRIDC